MTWEVAKHVFFIVFTSTIAALLIATEVPQFIPAISVTSKL